MVLPLMTATLEALEHVRTRPSKTPQDGSPALLAFDPRVSRRLHTVIPIRVVDLPEQNVVWTSLERLLYGWADVDYLRDSNSISSWQVSPIQLLQRMSTDRKQKAFWCILCVVVSEGIALPIHSVAHTGMLRLDQSLTIAPHHNYSGSVL